MMIRSIHALFLCALPLLCVANGDWTWSQPHAEVLPTGDLKWAPQPFEFKAGPVVRYIDFEQGKDSNDGTKEHPWKHHPWDKNATSKAALSRGPVTYVFKRGVVYRGTLEAYQQQGTKDNLLRLTSDPEWGDGEACIYGSNIVTGWTRGAKHPDIPTGDKVWYADIDFAPRGLWMVAADGAITRIPLARTPNWSVSDPDDVKSEWWELEQPEWWKGVNITEINGTKHHLAIDKKHLTEDPDHYVGGKIWSEWGIMMGTPYAAEIKAVDPETGGLAFEGPWGRDSQRVITGNRYFLEDKPHYLDAPGEFWFDRSAGRLYLRLPEDADPNTVSIEAANRVNMIDTGNLSHVEISGLSFRFQNQVWDYGQLTWMHPDVDNAAFRMTGSGPNINVRNCRFEHVSKAIAIHPKAWVRGLAITDNDIDYTDHGGISLSHKEGGIREVLVLRNRIRHIGMRPARVNGHAAVSLSMGTTAEFAGNILDRCYGPGLFIFGGKGSGADHDVPLVRILIHHNKVTDALLNTNDWGNIETWQGGPFYVYNNVSGNPGGHMNWRHRPGKPASARFGFAYYLDGAFKNYHFNNIAWGKNNEPGSKYANTAPFQEIHSYQNTFFNNTAYKFMLGTRRQRPDAGRNKFLGNIFSDIHGIVFRHSDAKGTDPNVADAGDEGEHFAYETNAYSNNILHDIGNIGVFEAEGFLYAKAEAFAQALKERGSMAAGLGKVVEQAPLRDSAAHDFRPTDVVQGYGARVFVPWGLARTVGEWHFTRNNKDPKIVIDEHWYMTPYHIQRTGYHSRPMYPLNAVNISADSYQEGRLEDWAPGVLTLDGNTQHLTLNHEGMTQPFSYKIGKRKKSRRVASGPELKNPDIYTENFIIEAYLKIDGDSGTLVRKMAGQAGYELSVTAAGTLRLLIADGEKSIAATSQAAINNGEWQHILAEVERGKKGALRLYINGKLAESSSDGEMPAGSLHNSSDLYVGGGPELDHLRCSLDFLRIALGTLAESRTSIEELHDWQFNGPQFRDFTGAPPTDTRYAGAIEGR